MVLPHCDIVNPSVETPAVCRVLTVLEGAERVVVVTGAGMSAESGVPTFRDALTGLWARYDPEELATQQAFRRNPARVFGWYLARLHGVRRVEPHPGYHALVEMARLLGQLPIVTQNVDGLHRRAGSEDVIELHGSLLTFRCLDGGHAYAVDDVLALGAPEVDAPVDPPTCLQCGSFVRPCVVWFGEMLPMDALQRAWDLVSSADAVIVVGTSAMVYPAAELPVIAKAAGARVIEINPIPTPLTPQADVYWAARAGDALPQLTRGLRAGRMTA
jgi:NAD-dependent deacetylase